MKDDTLGGASPLWKDRFQFDWNGNQPARFLTAINETIELRDSESVGEFFDLCDGTVLGVDHGWQCYQPEYIHAGWRAAKRPYPMAVWDLSTGERVKHLRGFSYGHVVGAKLLDQFILITWARDYVLRVWDLATGVCQEELPLPLWRDDAGQAVLSSSRFGDLPPNEQLRYVRDQHLPAPTVQLEFLPIPEAEQTSLCFSPRANSSVADIKPWTPAVFPNRDHFAHHILDIQGVEAGYSTQLLLNDGRLLVGGTSYGASGYIYVWDGLYRLNILQPGGLTEELRLAGTNIVEAVKDDRLYRFSV